MKRFIFIAASLMLLVAGAGTLMAQTGELPVEDAGFVIDLTTFTGMVALISAIVTQLLKLIPRYKAANWQKSGFPQVSAYLYAWPRGD